MLGPAARHGGLERGLAGRRRGWAPATPLRSLPRSLPPAPQGPARRAPPLTCADVRGPGLRGGGGTGPRLVTMATGAPPTSAAGREGGSQGRRAGPGRRVRAGRRGPGVRGRLAAARGGVAAWPAQLPGRPAEGRERALVGGTEGCSDPDPVCGLLPPPRRSPRTWGPSRQNRSPVTAFGPGKGLWLGNALLAGPFLCILSSSVSV